MILNITRTLESTNPTPAGLTPAGRPLDLNDVENQPLPKRKRLPITASVTAVTSHLLLSVPRVSTETYIYGLVWQALQSRFESQPHHPMFGEPMPGRLRMSLDGPIEKGTTLSWKKKARHLANLVIKLSQSHETQRVPFS